MKMNEHIYSYPTVYAIGHSAIKDIFNGKVLVEEKVDGSQFSFQRTADGELLCRSKGKQIVIDAPDKMFEKAIESVKERFDKLRVDWIYRCEYLEKPHHNAIAYDRIPNGHLIGFDVGVGLENYLPYERMKEEFEFIGLECVPILYEGEVKNIDEFNKLLDNISILGGSKIEGVVVKNYSLFTLEKKVAMGKYVSEGFKEIHEGEWRINNPAPSDILTSLITKYKTPARWNKAIQHLKENGNLSKSPKDIGNLINEVKADTKKECEEEIKETLFKHYWSKIERGITAGLPEWYKEELLKSAFEETQE